MTEHVVSLQEARSIVEQHAAELRPHSQEMVSLLESNRRVLSEEICADRDFPPFPRAIRDGYAMLAADLAHAPARLKVVGEIRAGQSGSFAIHSGEAAEIMTGAPLPEGADAVVMVEYTRRDGGHVVIERAVESGENFVPRGAEAKPGDVLLAPGHRMDFVAVAMAASVGKSVVQVYARPRVAVLATGDEIVETTAVPEPHQIRNSNTYSLAVQVRDAGAEPVLVPVAPDEPQRLRELLREGLGCDLLLITGGVSMGKYDLVEQELSKFGADFFFTGAKIQPGKPVVFGQAERQLDMQKPASGAGRERNIQRTFFLGLPGNPISTMVTFELFARPLINALSGAPAGKLRFLRARLKSEIRTKTGLTRFLPGRLSGEYDNVTVEFVPWKGSGDLAAQSRANCYIVVPPDRESIRTGEAVDVMLR